jgi:hypothetical protein
MHVWCIYGAFTAFLAGTLPFIVHTVYIYVGWARTTYTCIRCTYGIFSKEITVHTVLYGVYIRLWPTLRVRCTYTVLANPERGVQVAADCFV